MSLRLPLTKGHQAIVSEADFSALSRFKWCAVIRSGLPYAVRFVRGDCVAMHRIITNAPVGMCVDHINHDTLDNRRENLRVCTKAENLRNRRSRRGQSRFKGVSPTLQKKWRVDVRENGRSKYVGTFENETDAAAAYDKAASARYGDYAALNLSS